MTDINNGGPAFPHTITHGAEGERLLPDEFGLGGMTLRDWFAGQALAGVCSDPDFAGNVATWCYKTADAMLAERAKP